MIDDKGLIGELIEGFHLAVHDKDAQKAIACFADDALIFDLAPPLQSKPYRADSNPELEDWFATWRSPIVIADRDLVIETGGEIGYSQSLQHLTGNKLDGEDVDLWYRATMGFRRSNDRWYIAHLHESVPFAMDGTGRALLDLRP